MIINIIRYVKVFDQTNQYVDLVKDSLKPIK